MKKGRIQETVEFRLPLNQVAEFDLQITEESSFYIPPRYTPLHKRTRTSSLSVHSKRCLHPPTYTLHPSTRMEVGRLESGARKEEEMDFNSHFRISNIVTRRRKVDNAWRSIRVDPRSEVEGGGQLERGYFVTAAWSSRVLSYL